MHLAPLLCWQASLLAPERSSSFPFYSGTRFAGMPALAAPTRVRRASARQGACVLKISGSSGYLVGAAPACRSDNLASKVALS